MLVVVKAVLLVVNVIRLQTLFKKLKKLHLFVWINHAQPVQSMQHKATILGETLFKPKISGL